MVLKGVCGALAGARLNSDDARTASVIPNSGRNFLPWDVNPHSVGLFEQHKSSNEQQAKHREEKSKDKSPSHSYIGHHHMTVTFILKGPTGH